MKIHTWVILSTTALATVVACGGPRVESPAKLPQKASTMGTTIGRDAVLRFKVAQLAPRFGTLAIEPYTRAEVNHLVVKLFELVGALEVPVVDGIGEQVKVDLSNAQLDDTIVFSNLEIGKTYRVKCEAYKNPGTESADLISTADANSYSDITVDEQSQSITYTVKVKLIDQDGTKSPSGSIEITAGTVTSGGPIGITVAP